MKKIFFIFFAIAFSSQKTQTLAQSFSDGGQLQKNLWFFEENHIPNGWASWKILHDNLPEENVTRNYTNDETDDEEESEESQISNFIFSANNNYIAAKNRSDNWIKIWNAQDRSSESFYTYRGFISLISSGDDSTFFVNDIASNDFIKQIVINPAGIQEPLRSLNIGDRWKIKELYQYEHYLIIISHSPNSGYIIDLDTNRVITQLPQEIANNEKIYYNAQKNILAGFKTNSSKITIWSVSNNIPFIGKIQSFSFNQLGTEFAILSDNNLIIYKADTGKELLKRKLEDAPTDIALNSHTNEIVLIFADKARIDFISRTTGQLVKRIYFSSNRISGVAQAAQIKNNITVNKLAFSPDGNMLGALIGIYDNQTYSTYLLLLKNTQKIETDAIKLLEMAQSYLVGYQGRPANYAKAIETFNLIMRTPGIDQHIKNKARLNLAGMYLRGEGQPGNQPDIAQAQQLYNDIISEPPQNLLAEDRNRAQVALNLINQRKRRKKNTL
jgi:hypothetical protein